MFHMPIESRIGIPSSVDHLLAFVGKPLPFPAAMDLCSDQVPDATDCDGLRFAAAARKSTSPQAFRPAFATADWRVFASFCVARRLPAGHRVMVPGRADRTLRFVVEGSLWQESPRAPAPAEAAAARRDPRRGRAVLGRAGDAGRPHARGLAGPRTLAAAAKGADGGLPRDRLRAAARRRRRDRRARPRLCRRATATN